MAKIPNMLQYLLFLMIPFHPPETEAIKPAMVAK
jgi:hypothetical protein